MFQVQAQVRTWQSFFVVQMFHLQRLEWVGVSEAKVDMRHQFRGINSYFPRIGPFEDVI